MYIQREPQLFPNNPAYIFGYGRFSFGNTNIPQNRKRCHWYDFFAFH
ncbi:hypothetical protein I656_01374 [Geobacillus sp. WSUCF1]|nr:hypothetical protein I656_01374 [Geobacillus sp. WSUCF1]